MWRTPAPDPPHVHGTLRIYGDLRVPRMQGYLLRAPPLSLPFWRAPPVPQVWNPSHHQAQASRPDRSHEREFSELAGADVRRRAVPLQVLPLAVLRPPEIDGREAPGPARRKPGPRQAGREAELPGIPCACQRNRAPPPLHPAPEDIPLAILYEDEDLVAVDKPAGMVVHAGAGIHSGTLVNALLHRFEALSGVGGPLRPGIVHRLDRYT